MIEYIDNKIKDLNFELSLIQSEYERLSSEHIEKTAECKNFKDLELLIAWWRLDVKKLKEKEKQINNEFDMMIKLKREIVKPLMSR